MKKIIIVLALALLLVGCGHKEPIEETVELRKSAQHKANERISELIIAEVEIAYSMAYMKNVGDPTIKQVSEQFSMDGASMDSNGNITTDATGISCKTTTTNNMLSVTCKTGDTIKMTSSGLTISK